MPKARMSPFALMTILTATGFLVGVGLCGLDFALASHGIGKSTEEFGVGPLDGVSLAVMILSALGLVLTLLLRIVVAIVRSFSHKESEPQTLLDAQDQTKRQDQQ